MPRFRSSRLTRPFHRALLSLFFGLGVLLSVRRGRGQTPSTPRVLQLGGTLPPVDRGVVPRAMGIRADHHATRVPTVVDGRITDRMGGPVRDMPPGRVIVKFRAGTSTASVTTALAASSRSARMSARPSYANFDIVTIDADEDAEAVAQAFQARPDVEYAQAAYRVGPRLVPNDSLYKGYQWNFPNIDLERAWDIQPGSSPSIVVAVVDSGIAYQNATMQYQAFSFTLGGVGYPALGTVTIPFARAPELAQSGSAGDSRFVAPYDFIWDTNRPFDLDGHGTHVAGTLGQLTNNGTGLAGVAYNVRIMPVKVIAGQWDDVFHSPYDGTDDTVARGIYYAADKGAQIINMSIGRLGPAGSAPAVEDAVRYAVNKGVFVVIAGGNGYFDDNNATEALAEIASRVQGCVSVAATNRSNRRSDYSTTGSWIELAAPGGDLNDFIYQQTYDFDVTDTFNLPPSQYRAPRFDVMAYWGIAGTSMAAPHVSGLAALLMSQGVTKPAAIEAALERFADDLGSKGRDPETGFGKINARSTLRGLGLAR